MKIAYLLGFEINENITGGQKYDANLLSVLKENTDHTVYTRVLKLSSRYPVVMSPFGYLVKSLRNKDYDLALINSVFFLRFFFLPSVLRIFSKKKFIAIHHHFMYRQFDGAKRAVYKKFEWRFLKQMDKVIAASPYVYEELKKQIPEEKLILNQIPFEVEAEYESDPQPGKLTYVGTIEERKGLVFLLKALVELKKRGKNYPLTIIGKGSEDEYYESLKKIIDENDLKVEFTGYIPKSEINRHLSATDVFVFPSLLEGYGMVLVEAQVYGLPIVSFDNSAMPFNVKNDINGYAVETGNILKFADAIEKIVENRNLRARLSHGALENLKNQNTPENFRLRVIEEFGKMK